MISEECLTFTFTYFICLMMKDTVTGWGTTSAISKKNLKKHADCPRVFVNLLWNWSNLRSGKLLKHGTIPIEAPQGSPFRVSVFLQRFGHQCVSIGFGNFHFLISHRVDLNLSCGYPCVTMKEILTFGPPPPALKVWQGKIIEDCILVASLIRATTAVSTKQPFKWMDFFV